MSCCTRSNTPSDRAVTVLICGPVRRATSAHTIRGCTALGHTAIVNFLTTIGLGNDYPRAQLAHHIVTSKCIEVEGNQATMTAYWNELTGPDDEATPPTTTTTVSDGGQYNNST